MEGRAWIPFILRITVSLPTEELFMRPGPMIRDLVLLHDDRAACVGILVRPGDPVSLHKSHCRPAIY